MMLVRILADDLTGALDSAAAFGDGVVVHIDHPPHDHGVSMAAIECVATESRDVPVSQLPAILAPCVPWLKRQGVAFKKIDSLLRGNTFAEIGYLAHAGGFHGVVFAPAFPAQGRVTYADQHWRHRDPTHVEQIGPLSLQQALAEQGLMVGAPDDAVTTPSTPKVWLPEVRSDQDLLAVVAKVSQYPGWLWCGSGGLAFALAQQLGIVRRSPATAGVQGSKPCVLISASFQASLKRQWQVLKAALAQPITAECADDDERIAAVKQFHARPDFAMFDLSPLQRLDQVAAASLLQRQIDDLVQTLPRPDTLLVVGGDTLLALCRATGAEGFVAEVPTRSGWGHARFSGGVWDGVRCHSRSGAFGQEDDLLTMVQMMNIGTFTQKDS